MGIGRGIRALGCIFVAVLLASCGGGSGNSNTHQIPANPIPGIPPKSIRITSPSITSSARDPGETLQLKATGVYDDGSEYDLTNAVAWSTTAGTVATVAANGLLTVLARGATVVTAKFGQVSGRLGYDTEAPPGWSFRVHSPRLETDPGPYAEPFIVLQIFEPEAPKIASVRIASKTIQLHGEYVLQCGEAGGSCQVANLDPSDLTSGPYAFVFTLEDASNNGFEWVQEAVLDRPPVVTVSQTAMSASVARPTILLQATCSDDSPAGCTSLKASIGSTILAEGKDSIDATVDLSAFDGGSVQLVYRGTDSAGSGAGVSKTIVVDTSTHLMPVDQVPGIIWDADANRILYEDQQSLRMYIRERATKLDTVIYSTSPPAPKNPQTANFRRAFLTAAGAAIEALVPPSGAIKYFSYENGTLVDLGADTTTTLTGKGAYLAWNFGWLRRRNVLTQETVTVFESSTLSPSVAANGQVVFLAVTGVVSYGPAGLTSVADRFSPFVSYANPVTDGMNILYDSILFDTATNSPTHSLVLNRNGTQQVIAQAAQGPSNTFSYRIAGGWVAYLYRNPMNVRQVTRISPQDQETVLAASEIEALGEDGTLVFPVDDRRYVVPADSAVPVDVGVEFGKVMMIDNVPHIFMGGELFAIR